MQTKYILWTTKKYQGAMNILSKKTHYQRQTDSLTNNIEGNGGYGIDQIFLSYGEVLTMYR